MRFLRTSFKNGFQRLSWVGRCEMLDEDNWDTYKNKFSKKVEGHNSMRD
jgi:hypothetical protein